jgi:hypothetical protein
MNKKSKSSSGGIGFCGLLAIAFIVLKLCNVIAWSWVWVLSPLWIPLALVLGILVVVGVCWLGLKILQHYAAKANRKRLKNKYKHK